MTDARASKQHVALSSEALSYLKPSEGAKASFLSLTEGFDVRIIMAYRPLESYYRSWYNHYRGADIYITGRRERKRCWKSVHYLPKVLGRSTFPQWFAYITEKHSGSNPLYTYETYKYVFGEERIKVLQLYHPDNVDIVQQFVCEGMGMEAKHSCEKLKNAGPPEMWNQARDDTPYEEDLVTTAAQFNNMLPFYKEGNGCMETSRANYAEALRVYLKDEHNKTIMDFENKACLSKEILDDFKERSWVAEQLLASSPKSIESFEQSFQKFIDADKHCSVDVNATFTNPIFVNFFNNKTMCIREKHRIKQ